MRRVTAILIALALLGLGHCARPADAAPKPEVTCSITLGPQPELVYMHVDGLDPKAGTTLNSLGGIKNYYLLALNGPGGQQVDSAAFVSSIIAPYYWQGPGHYEGIVDYTLDSGRWIKLTEKATCETVMP